MAAIVCGVDRSAPGDRSHALTMLEGLRRELDVPSARLRVDIGPARERLTTASIANRFAAALGLPLRLVHILPPAAGSGEPLSAPGAVERPWSHEAAYRLLELFADAVGGTPSLRVELGTAGRRLAQEATAREAGLLVVGAPTRRGPGAALTGSASAHLMRRSQRPLVICSGASVPGRPRVA